MAAKTVAEKIAAIEAAKQKEIDAVIEAEKGPLLEKRAKLEADLAAVDKELASLGVAAPKKKSSARTGTVKQPSKPKAADEDWLQIMTEVVGDNPGITADEAYELTKSKLSEKGFQTRGPIRSKFDGFIEDARFDVKSGKVSLAKVSA